MRQTRIVRSLNFARPKPGQLPTSISLSDQAQAFVDEATSAGEAVRFVVELTSEGELTATLDASSALLARARELQLQARVDFVADGYNIRKVDFSKIHGVAGADLDKFVDALELSDGARVLDLMCGYGAVSTHVVDYAQRKGIAVGVSMCDLHEVQLARIPDDTRAAAHDVTTADARDLPYGDAEFDAVAIKMGLHEVPHIDQPLVLQEICRVLKPGGRFVLWEVMPDTGPQQDAFTEQMQKKNELAGYESIVVDRYFLRGQQIPWLFGEAGLVDVEEVFEADFHQSTLGRLDSELGGDRHKLAELNEFVRRCTPDQIRAEVDYSDDGDSIAMKVPNRIFRGVRPRK